MRHVHGLRAAASRRTYATWNPSDKGSGVTLSGDNLTASASAGWNSVRATQGKTTGKWYFELTINAATGIAGFGDGTFDLNTYLGATANGASYYDSGPTIFANGFTSGGATTLSGTGTFYFAIDLDAKKAWIGKGASWSRSGDPAAGTNPQWTWAGSYTIFPACGVIGGSATVTANFGASAFSSAAPSGFNSGWYS